MDKLAHVVDLGVHLPGKQGVKLGIFGREAQGIEHGKLPRTSVEFILSLLRV